MAQFDLSRDDYFRASWHMQRRYRLRLAVWALCVGGLVAVCFGYSRFGWGAGLAAGVIGGCLGYVLRLYLNRRRIHRIYDDHLATHSAGVLTVDGEGYGLALGGSTVRIQWDQLKFWGESGHFLLLYRGRDFAQIIPKQALSPAEEGEIRSHLEGIRKL